MPGAAVAAMWAPTLWYLSECGLLSGRCCSCHTRLLGPTAALPRQKAAEGGGEQED